MLVKRWALPAKDAAILRMLVICLILLKNTPGNGKFLYGAYERFTNEDLLQLLHDAGLETKVERGGRVFPASDSALDVRNTFYEADETLWCRCSS